MALQQKNPADISSRKHPNTFIRFVFAGIFASAVYYIIGNILELLNLFPVMAANTLAYVCGMVASYTSQKAWTFRNTAPHAQTIPLFLLSSLAGLGLNSIIVWALLAVQLRYYIASLAAIALTAFFSYFVQRFIVFAKKI